MTTQKFIDDIIKTEQSDYISAIKVLLNNHKLEDNLFNLITLLDTYSLPDISFENIISRYLCNETFDISSYETE